MMGFRFDQIRGLTLLAVFAVADLLAGAASASIIPAEVAWQTMTVDEILFRSTANGGDPDFDPAGTVRMDVIDSFLYIELTNTSTDATPTNNAGNVLVALGFSLPTGVYLGSPAGSLGSTNNDLELGSGSSLTGSGTLNNQKWGLAFAANAGHFDGDPNVLTYGSVLATHIPDADVTLTGVPAGNTNIGQFNYSLKSESAGSGPSGNGPFVEDQLLFKLELFGDIPGNILSTIEASAVGLAFDSPDASSLPEPASFVVWFLIGLTWAGSAWTYRYRRRWQKWQREEEEAAALAGIRGNNQADRFAGCADQIETHTGVEPVEREPSS